MKFSHVKWLKISIQIAIMSYTFCYYAFYGQLSQTSESSPNAFNTLRNFPKLSQLCKVLLPEYQLVKIYITFILPFVEWLINFSFQFNCLNIDAFFSNNTCMLLLFRMLLLKSILPILHWNNSLFAFTTN